MRPANCRLIATGSREKPLEARRAYQLTKRLFSTAYRGLSGPKIDGRQLTEILDQSDRILNALMIGADVLRWLDGSDDPQRARLMRNE